MPSQSNQLVSIVELERAINFWRSQLPSSRDTMTLCPQASCLAELYAQMIISQSPEISLSEFSENAKKAFAEARQTAVSKDHKAA